MEEWLEEAFRKHGFRVIANARRSSPRVLGSDGERWVYEVVVEEQAEPTQ